MVVLECEHKYATPVFKLYKWAISQSCPLRLEGFSPEYLTPGVPNGFFAHCGLYHRSLSLQEVKTRNDSRSTEKVLTL